MSKQDGSKLMTEKDEKSGLLSKMLLEQIKTFEKSI